MGKPILLMVVVVVALLAGCSDSEPKAETTTFTAPSNPEPHYSNADGRTPKCFENFKKTGQVCNTDPEIVDVSQVALDNGGTSALNEIDRQLLNACVSNGDSLYDCSAYITSTVIPLILDNLVHGMPQRDN